MYEVSLENIMKVESKEVIEIESQIEKLEREHIRVLQELLLMEMSAGKTV